MPKKIALFVLGLMLAVGAFFLYQWATGAHTGGVMIVPKKVATEAAQTLPAAFEERDEQGRLVYLIRAAKSPEPVIDPATKQPIPNQFLMSEPEATFYRVGGRVMHITADSCQVVFDQSPRLGAGGGGKLRDQINLRTGELRGNVRIYISGQYTTVAATTQSGTQAATQPAKDPFPNGVLMFVDGPVVYDRTQGQLIANDGVHVRSELADFDGTGLKLAINQEAQRIDFLRIEKGDQVVLRKFGDRFKVLQATTGPASQPGAPTAVAGATTGPATKPGKAPTIYRLTMSQDVVAKSAERSLEAQALSLVFSASEDIDRVKSGNAAGNATGVGGPDPPAIPDLPTSPSAITPAGADDVRVTWAGPLELRPTDNVQLGSDDQILEAQGSKDKPLLVVDGSRRVRAGHLRDVIHKTEHRIELEPSDSGDVVLGDARSQITCKEAILLPEKATFKGPGTLVRDKGEKETDVAWKKELAVDLQAADAGANGKNQAMSFTPTHATMDGVTIRAPQYTFAAEMLDAAIETVKDGTFLPSHVMAKGGVVASSFGKDETNSGTRMEMGGMKSDAMEILFANSSDGPVPTQMVATGNVSGWHFRHPTGLGMLGSETAPAATGPFVIAASKEPRFERDAIQAGKLVADLQAKPKTDTQPARGRGDDASTDPSGITPSHLAAQDNVIIDITPAATQKFQLIEARATTLDALPDDGKFWLDRGPMATSRRYR